MTKIITIKDGKLIGFTSNHELSLAQLIKIKGKYGDVYRVSDEQFEQAKAEYDVEIVKGKPVFTKGERAIEKENRDAEKEKDKLYQAIGELGLLKLSGKEGLDAEIIELKTKLI